MVGGLLSTRTNCVPVGTASKNGPAKLIKSSFAILITLPLKVARVFNASPPATIPRLLASRAASCITFCATGQEKGSLYNVSLRTRKIERLPRKIGLINDPFSCLSLNRFPFFFFPRSFEISTTTTYRSTLLFFAMSRSNDVLRTLTASRRKSIAPR